MFVSKSVANPLSDKYGRPAVCRRVVEWTIVTIHGLSFEATGYFHLVRHRLLDCRVQFGR